MKGPRSGVYVIHLSVSAKSRVKNRFSGPVSLTGDYPCLQQMDVEILPVPVVDN